MISTAVGRSLDPKHSTPFPLVCKVSSTHAGYGNLNFQLFSELKVPSLGKMRANDEHDLKDLRCILALHKDYFTYERYSYVVIKHLFFRTEPLIEFEYEFRVQKIGKHYRAFRRN